MIESFKHAGLAALFEKGRSAKVGREVSERALTILDHLEAATSQKDLVGVRGFHPLKPRKDRRFAMSVTGNWRITFRWSEAEGKAYDVDLEDYH